MKNSKRWTFLISWAFIDYWLWPDTAPPAGVLTGLQNCCCLPEEMWEPLDQVPPPPFVSSSNVVFFILLRQKSLKKCLQQKRRRRTTQCHFKAWGFCAGKCFPHDWTFVRLCVWTAGRWLTTTTSRMFLHVTQTASTKVQKLGKGQRSYKEHKNKILWCCRGPLFQTLLLFLLWSSCVADVVEVETSCKSAEATQTA